MGSLKELLKVVLGLGLVGFVVYLIITYIPMPDIIKTVITVLVAVACIFWLLNYLPF